MEVGGGEGGLLLSAGSGRGQFFFEEGKGCLMLGVDGVFLGICGPGLFRGACRSYAASMLELMSWREEDRCQRSSGRGTGEDVVWQGGLHVK